MRLIYPHVKPKKDLLVALGAGAIGHDAILKEGHDAAARDGFALTRLGKVPVMAFEAREGDEYALVSPHQLVAVRGRVNRFDALQAEEIIQAGVEEQDQDIHPYADPYYWAGFQITGW